jgi:(4-(4-[2-(gamma-L-glutamylamino)ethyl]phenoxymethyl)furan-2-yl)methanamine synthase
MSKANISQPIVGWDIGGAHLKAVLLNGEGEIVQVLQLPCTLWKGLNYLEAAISDALQAFKIKASEASHAITMTGELVDLFENRHEGVMAISSLAAKLLGKHTIFYAANSGFVTLDGVSTNIPHIASTNWHASASTLAMYVQDALLIDIGSTTTDIIPIIDGKVSIEALSDAARLQNDTLVYTGVVRTPIMALAQKLAFEGAEVNVMAEHFATMADAYRLTGELLPQNDMAETADGKGKAELESARRLARMVGRDVESKPIESWKNLAQACKSAQMEQIKSAVLKQLKPNMTIIGAGAGSFLVKQIAHELNHAYQPISTCFSRTNNQLQQVYSAGMTLAVTEHKELDKKHDLEVCFPAYAVAFLLKNQLARNHA